AAGLDLERLLRLLEPRLQVVALDLDRGQIVLEVLHAADVVLAGLLTAVHAQLGLQLLDAAAQHADLRFGLGRPRSAALRGRAPARIDRRAVAGRAGRGGCAQPRVLHHRRAAGRRGARVAAELRGIDEAQPQAAAADRIAVLEQVVLDALLLEVAAVRARQ